MRAAAHMDSSTFLYDVPPVVVESFCKIMDSGGDSFGWRALAVRIAPTLLEVRMLERIEAAGRSPTRELLWSWAQQNSTVQDLLKVLQDMGHHRALQLFQSQPKDQLPSVRESPLSPSNQHKKVTGQTSAAKVKESPQVKASSSSPALSPKKPSGEKQPPIFMFHDIIEGTRAFHHEMRISEGQFSDVYRAEMGNKTFAVKLFKQKNMASWKKLWDIFRKEMEIHNLYQHPNILELLGCFSDEGRYCLVYPYLPSGSLFHRLHHQTTLVKGQRTTLAQNLLLSSAERQEVTRVLQHVLQTLLAHPPTIHNMDREPPLSWQDRLNIIKGIAKALHHLHTTQPCPVICGNISSANILLDDDLQPKLSDFGLARLRPHSTNQHCTITLDTSHHNNLGYLPEEYIRDGKLSFSLDVYSFGMVIMETITGRKVIEDVPKQTQLRDLLITQLDSGGVDSCLQFLDEAAGRWPTALALSLLGLTLECIASRHRSRPSMENVLPVLSQLLPPPVCPLTDQPRTLVEPDGIPLNHKHVASSSIPVEDDEQHSLPGPLAQAGPCECSQSEVTYLSDIAGADGEAVVDLYCSWPVQCSCPAETSSLACEDCRANGFTPNHTDSPQTDVSVVENAAKQRMRSKLSLYNKGLIDTEELLSETGLQ